MATELAGSTHS